MDDWRGRMADGGLRDPGVLEELEGHLREEIATRMAAGADAAAAFHAGTARLGGPEALSAEFIKLDDSRVRRIKRAWLALAGIPPAHQPPTMNTTDSSTNTEPLWATYIRATVFLTPAVLLCTFAVMYLMPKLELVCQRAGVALPGVYQAGLSAADHPTPILLAIVLSLALLEWRCARWQRFRRVSLGAAVLVINTAVMVFMTTMLIFALLAAPNLASQAP